jgi:hypothetical protein
MINLSDRTDNVIDAKFSQTQGGALRGIEVAEHVTAYGFVCCRVDQTEHDVFSSLLMT